MIVRLKDRYHKQWGKGLPNLFRAKKDGNCYIIYDKSGRVAQIGMPKGHFHEEYIEVVQD